MGAAASVAALQQFVPDEELTKDQCAVLIGAVFDPAKVGFAADADGSAKCLKSNLFKAYGVELPFGECI